MTATSSAMASQVKDHDRVMEPHNVASLKFPAPATAETRGRRWTPIAERH
jgi:hypothetical protein